MVLPPRHRKKRACFLPRPFEPRGTNELIRLGSDHDGGYVVSTDAVASTRHLVSFGLGDNCDFEFDFSAMARLKSLTGYDNTIDDKALRRQFTAARLKSLIRPGPHRKFITYYKQYGSLFLGDRPGFSHLREEIGISSGQTSPETAVTRLDPLPGTVFLKVDTDGGEYDFLDQIIECNELLSGVVIVFRDVPARMREIEVFLGAMREFMTIDNTTTDNDADVDGDGIPNAIEISLSSKIHAEPHIPIAGATRNYNRLNEPNNPGKIDFEIVYLD